MLCVLLGLCTLGCCGASVLDEVGGVGSKYVCPIISPPSLPSLSLLISRKASLVSFEVKPWRRRKALTPSPFCGVAFSWANAVEGRVKKNIVNSMDVIYAFMFAKIVKTMLLL